MPDPDGDEYSTVDECASIRSQAGSDQTRSVTPESVAAGPASSGPPDEPLNMVECELYSEALGGVATSTMPDISPYACFYGAPKHQVFKAGWLDKLSPQGYVPALLQRLQRLQMQQMQIMSCISLLVSQLLSPVTQSASCHFPF